VRPLCDDESDSPQAITRDYTLELEQELDQAPLLSIFGGKLTTYRKLGETAMKMLNPYFSKMGKPWTRNVALPGGDFDYPRTQLVSNICNQHPWLSEKTATRYVNQFGTLVWTLLENVTSEADMGRVFSEGVYQAEIDYLMQHEFSQKAEDVLWRRTKLGLYLSQEQQAEVTQYMIEKLGTKKRVELAQVS